MGTNEPVGAANLWPVVYLNRRLGYTAADLRYG